jgi:hypothetical protein
MKFAPSSTGNAVTVSGLPRGASSFDAPEVQATTTVDSNDDYSHH